MTAAIFHPFQPHLVIGGTYAGHVLVWDTRAKSMPVLKSSMSAGHTHPLYCMKMIGSQNAHNLVSISSDGLLCTWQLDMLAQPLVSLHFRLAKH